MNAEKTAIQRFSDNMRLKKRLSIEWKTPCRCRSFSGSSAAICVTILQGKAPEEEKFF